MFGGDTTASHAPINKCSVVVGYGVCVYTLSWSHGRSVGRSAGGNAIA